jgi:GT2 family glycosyltransferase
MINSDPLVSIIVVNYNGLKYCRDCFRSIRELNYPNYEVLMVDNFSTDGSVDYINDNFPEVKIIKLEKNLGFATANNIGADNANGEYLFFVNQDTALERNCLSNLLEAIQSDPTIGICGCKMLYWNDKNVINSTGLIANKISFVWDRGSFELDQGQYDDQNEVLSVSGAAMLMRKDLFLDLGGFDVKYFMYYEDLDIGMRTWLTGYRVLYVPDARIYHNTQYKHADQYHFQYIDQRNRLRTIVKLFSLYNLVWMLLRSLFYDLTSIISWLRLRKFSLIKYRMMAVLWNLRMLPNTLSERRKVQRRRAVPDGILLNMMTPDYRAPVLPVAVPNYIVKSRDTLNQKQVKNDLNIGDNDNEQLGYGWYERENWNGKQIRWTTNYASAFLKRLGKGSKNEEFIEIEMYSPLRTEIELYLNDQIAGEFEFKEPGWQTFNAKLIDQEELQKVLLTTQGFRPNKINPLSSDKRLLGVAVSRLNIKSY